VPLLLANYMFGGSTGLSNRLLDRLRQRDGISYSTWSALTVRAHDRAGAWQIGGLVAPQNSTRLEQGVREELDRMLKDGFTAKEIEDAKSGFLQERVLGRSDDGNVAMTWTGLLDAGRTFAFSKQIEERIGALTGAEVIAAVRRHIDPNRMTVVIAGDAKKGAK
jgi:zinc protease